MPLWLELPTRFTQPILLHFPSTPDPRGERQTYSPQEFFLQYVIFSQSIHPVLGYLARRQLETAHFVGAEVHHVQSPPPLLLRHFPPNPQSTEPTGGCQPTRSAQSRSTKGQRICFKMLLESEKHILRGQGAALLFATQRVFRHSYRVKHRRC